MPHDTAKILEATYEASKVVFIGVSGGVAQSLYAMKKGEKITVAMFFVNMFLAGFLTYMVDGIVPQNAAKSFVLGMTGFAAFPILKMIESSMPETIKSFLSFLAKK